MTLHWLSGVQSSTQQEREGDTVTHVFFLNFWVRTETVVTSDVRPNFLQPYSGSHNANTPFDRTMSACSVLSCCSYLWERHSFGGILDRHPLNLHMLFAPCITLQEFVDTCVGLAHRGRGPLVQACLESRVLVETLGSCLLGHTAQAVRRKPVLFPCEFYIAARRYR